ncbi:uncharacterized protein DNG_00838 [Cephalotrichum gorgonifer]|uniref:Uncharacterized protein n=1 Tax=Cephalotrichum gorgonifer TaxID=2041049 RepID=A0AAE8MRX8_9PEZI|nr:uncharacterized protein DNG_00838 [Cephalotrichum gorgonifer]
MAFHQPTRQALQRPVQVVPPQEQDDIHAPTPHHVQHSSAPNESQTWVLFPPGGNAASSSYLGESDQSLRTAGRSRASDFGSFDTNIRTDDDLASHRPLSLVAPETVDESALDDDAELDSLDSHLPDFRAVQSPYLDTSTANAYSAPVVPRHDGLGSFRRDQPTSGGADIQERIYAFERFNPNRISRGDEPDEVPDLTLDPDMRQRMQRIESWRLEQSRLLLEQIQKETRTRRSSHSSAATRPLLSTRSSKERAAPAELETTASVPISGEHDHLDWHGGDVQETNVESRGVLSQVARTFLGNLMGMDERLLSILLGETLPDETQGVSGGSRQHALAPVEEAPWQLSVLERVAKELGGLISLISHHPGAFSTYSRIQRMPLPYAGLPVIPEVTAAPAPSQPADRNDGISTTTPEFRPTIGHSTQAMNIQDSRHSSHGPAPSSNSSHATFTQEEWEQDLDIKLVFRYLRSRFGPRPSSSATSGGTSHLATSSTQDTAAKVARVRQYHPLVASRPRTAERRSFKATAPPAPVVLRHPSSCASQSTRRSGRRSSGSSRHYWDIGGSLGTGSVIASTGPMGSWGEA